MVNSQVVQHVNIVLPAVGPGLAGKNNDFLLGPLLVPRQSGKGNALIAARIGLCLVPGAEFLLYEEVSIGL